MIVTEDGIIVSPGDRAYNYYDRHWGVIDGEPDCSGWFTFQQDDGDFRCLNGARICSELYATKKGW